MNDRNRVPSVGLLALLAGILAACASLPPTLPADDVAARALEFDALVAAHVDAWNTHNLEQISALYTDDVVHDDGVTYRVGQRTVDLAQQMVAIYPHWGGELGLTFVGRDDGLYEWRIWGAPTSAFTAARPAIEYDLIEPRAGQIARWTRFLEVGYGDRTSRMSPDRLDLLSRQINAYAYAWSSGDPQKVAALYAPTAVRDDPLFDARQAGAQAIQDFAANFFTWYPDVRWEVDAVFGDEDANTAHDDIGLGATTGGVFAVGAPDNDGRLCPVQIAVLLDYDEAGQIADERLYYNADSLIACGWVR